MSLLAKVAIELVYITKEDRIFKRQSIKKSSRPYIYDAVYETCQTTNPYPDTNPYTLDTDPYPVYTDSYPVKFFFCIFLTYFFVENSALNSSLGNWKKFLKKVFLP